MRSTASSSQSPEAARGWPAACREPASCRLLPAVKAEPLPSPPSFSAADRFLKGVGSNGIAQGSPLPRFCGCISGSTSAPACGERRALAPGDPAGGTMKGSGPLGPSTRAGMSTGRMMPGRSTVTHGRPAPTAPVASAVPWTPGWDDGALAARPVGAVCRKAALPSRPPGGSAPRGGGEDVFVRGCAGRATMGTAGACPLASCRQGGPAVGDAPGERSSCWCCSGGASGVFRGLSNTSPDRAASLPPGLESFLALHALGTDHASRPLQCSGTAASTPCRSGPLSENGTACLAPPRPPPRLPLPAPGQRPAPTPRTRWCQVVQSPALPQYQTGRAVPACITSFLLSMCDAPPSSYVTMTPPAALMDVTDTSHQPPLYRMSSRSPSFRWLYGVASGGTGRIRWIGHHSLSRRCGGGGPSLPSSSSPVAPSHSSRTATSA
eukprot:scaffold5346_cov86-Isochrysis_galbana.AAC.2